MVFEADRDAIRTKITNNDFSGAKVDLEALIVKVETRYATLNTNQKRQWEDTRLQLPHIREHLQEALDNRSRANQRQVCLDVINGITVI
jgi:hypothetical protein